MFRKIKREISHIYHRVKTGVSYKDTWSLWWYIDSVIYEWLIKFKKVNNWHPCNISEQEWDNIIDEMIDWYRLLLEDKEMGKIIKWYENMYYTNEEQKKIKNVQKLYMKYKNHLWW